MKGLMKMVAKVVNGVMDALCDALVGSAPKVAVDECWSPWVSDSGKYCWEA